MKYIFITISNSIKFNQIQSICKVQTIYKLDVLWCIVDNELIMVLWWDPGQYPFQIGQHVFKCFGPLFFTVKLNSVIL